MDKDKPPALIGPDELSKVGIGVGCLARLPDRKDRAGLFRVELVDADWAPRLRVVVGHVGDDVAVLQLWHGVVNHAPDCKEKTQVVANERQIRVELSRWTDRTLSSPKSTFVF